MRIFIIAALMAACSSTPEPTDAERARVQCVTAAAADCAVLYQSMCPDGACPDIAAECAANLARCSAR